MFIRYRGEGVAKKHTNADRERGCSNKSGRTLRKKVLYHIFWKILRCDYSWILVIRALFLVDCRGTNPLINTNHCVLIDNFLLFQKSEPDGFCCAPNSLFGRPCERSFTVHYINKFDLNSNLHSISIPTFRTLLFRY